MKATIMPKWNTKNSLIKRLITPKTRLFHHICQDLERFFDLPRHEKKLFAEALAMLAVMKIAVSLTSFKFLTRSFALESNTEKNIPLKNQKERNTTVEISRAIRRAATYVSLENSCLVQALTAQRMLSKRGIPGSFYLGVSKGNGKFTAHAWLQCGDQIVTGNEKYREFRVLSVFLWGH